MKNILLTRNHKEITNLMGKVFPSKKNNQFVVSLKNKSYNEFAYSL